jgi:HSP20 family molecular chaperone IbpA
MTVDPEHIKATYGAGLLTLVLPKVEKAKPRQIKIEVTPEKALKA